MQCNHCDEEIKSDISICPRCNNTLKQHEKTDNIPTPPATINTDSDWYIKSKRNKVIGLLWIIVPIISLFLIPFLWAIIKFFLNSSDTSSVYVIVFRIITFILSLLGLVATVCILVGIPLGIVYLAKKELNPNMQYDERSGKKHDSEIPPEIRGWSWGAMFFSWIWGSYHNVWISFLSFIPLVNYIWWIVMGVRGREWAWKNDKWPSVEYFLEKQKKWDRWGLGLFLFSILVLILILILIGIKR
ncbi:MAG: hypothetical protein WC070_01260 [Candidatus Magasanikbacteria bacterium]